jgi:hypothetical protein
MALEAGVLRRGKNVGSVLDIHLFLLNRAWRGQS